MYTSDSQQETFGPVDFHVGLDQMNTEEATLYLLPVVSCVPTKLENDGCD